MYDMKQDMTRTGRGGGSGTEQEPTAPGNEARLSRDQPGGSERLRTFAAPFSLSDLVSHAPGQANLCTVYSAPPLT